MNNKKIFIVASFIILIYTLRQSYYYLGYLNILNENMVNIEVEEHVLKNGEYNWNQAFKYISIDTKTLSDLELECKMQESVNPESDNYLCGNAELSLFYISAPDSKLEYTEDTIISDEEIPFYKYEISGNDVISYLEKNKIASMIDLYEHLNNTQYGSAGFFSSISKMKEVSVANWLKFTVTPEHQKKHTVSKNNHEYTIYENGNRYIIESNYDDKGFSIVIKGDTVSLEKVLLLIDSIIIK